MGFRSQKKKKKRRSQIYVDILYLLQSYRLHLFILVSNARMLHWTCYSEAYLLHTKQYYGDKIKLGGMNGNVASKRNAYRSLVEKPVEGGCLVDLSVVGRFIKQLA
jgi:cytochrome c-type biogenesis protein CcmE